MCSYYDVLINEPILVAYFEAHHEHGFKEFILNPHKRLSLLYSTHGRTFVKDLSHLTQSNSAHELATEWSKIDTPNLQLTNASLYIIKQQGLEKLGHFAIAEGFIVIFLLKDKEIGIKSALDL